MDTNYVEKHVIVTDTSHIVIQFGAGGGTYNAQTGQATNVSGVQQSTYHNEQRDSTAFYKHQVESLTASNDSLSQSIGNYKSELKKEQAVPKRTFLLSSGGASRNSICGDKNMHFCRLFDATPSTTHIHPKQKAYF